LSFDGTDFITVSRNDLTTVKNDEKENYNENDSSDRKFSIKRDIVDFNLEKSTGNKRDVESTIKMTKNMTFSDSDD